jgi:TonB family protein
MPPDKREMVRAKIRVVDAPRPKPPVKVEPPKPRVEPPKPEPPRPEPVKAPEPPRPEPPKPEPPKAESPKPKVEPPRPEPPKPQAPGPKPVPRKWGANIDPKYTDSSSGGSGPGGSAVAVPVGDGMEGPRPKPEPKELADEIVLEGETTGPGESAETGPGVLDAPGGADGPAGPAAIRPAGVGGEGPRAKKEVMPTEAVHSVSTPAKVKKQVKVEYPEEVKALEKQGRVHLELVVDKEGKVADVTLTKGLHPVLDKVAMDAARQLEFFPATKDGRPVPVTIPYVFTFVLR